MSSHYIDGKSKKYYQMEMKNHKGKCILHKKCLYVLLLLLFIIMSKHFIKKLAYH